MAGAEQQALVAGEAEVEPVAVMVAGVTAAVGMGAVVTVVAVAADPGEGRAVAITFYGAYPPPKAR